MADPNTSSCPFEQIYPHVSDWVKSYEWIEIGYDDYSHTFVRALDIGGMIWEGEEDYLRWIQCQAQPLGQFSVRAPSSPS